MTTSERLSPREAARLIAARWGLAVDPRTVRRWIVRGELGDALTDPRRPTTSLARLEAVFGEGVGDAEYARNSNDR